MFILGILIVKYKEADVIVKRAKEIVCVVQKVLEKLSINSVREECISSEKKAIKRILINWIDNEEIDLILTIGGVGLEENEIIPEVTLDILEKRLPGMEEVIRTKGFNGDYRLLLSRGVAGVRKRSLIINLPMNLEDIKISLETIIPALPHAINKLKGDQTECGAQ